MPDTGLYQDAYHTSEGLRSRRRRLGTRWRQGPRKDRHEPRAGEPEAAGWLGGNGARDEEAKLNQGTTCTPQLRAEPTTILAIDSRLRWRMWSSVALILAISYTCFKDIVARKS